MFILNSFQFKAQVPYIDVPGFALRSIEETALYNYDRNVTESNKSLLKDSFISGMELISRSTLGEPTFELDEKKYTNVCDCYLNPISKNKCKKERDYLFKAAKLVTKIYKNSSSVYGDNGVIYQIKEQYVDVMNDINLGLVNLRIEANKWCFKK